MGVGQKRRKTGPVSDENGHVGANNEKGEERGRQGELSQRDCLQAGWQGPGVHHGFGSQGLQDHCPALKHPGTGTVAFI